MGLHHLDLHNIETVNLETIKILLMSPWPLRGRPTTAAHPGAWLYCENNMPTIHLIGTDEAGPDRPRVPDRQAPSHLLRIQPELTRCVSGWRKNNIKYNRWCFRVPQYSVLHAGSQQHVSSETSPPRRQRNAETSMMAKQTGGSPFSTRIDKAGSGYGQNAGAQTGDALPCFSGQRRSP